MLVTHTSRLHPSAGNNRYTIDHDDDRNPITCHVALDDDEAIGRAIRDALRGKS